MEVIGTRQILITHEIKASECARVARSFARDLGFGKARIGEGEIVAREISTNTARYALGGSVYIQATRSAKEAKLEFFAWDMGPGISNIALAMQDGHSSSDGLGHGLGAISRLSNTFAIDSQTGAGTRLYLQLLRERNESTATRTRQPELVATAASLPKLGEAQNGDNWAILNGDSSYKLLVVDGLGHGPNAAAASQAAIEIAVERRSEPCDVLMQRIHEGLAGTRGAVGAVLNIDLQTRRLEYAGVGNIRALYATPSHSQSLVSHNGTLGKQIRKVQKFEYDWEPGSQVLMHSDGLSQRWQADEYQRLAEKHPGLAIAALINNHQKTMDDCTVLVAKENRA